MPSRFNREMSPAELQKYRELVGLVPPDTPITPDTPTTTPDSPDAPAPEDV
jgi:hypothetical protein